MKIFISNITSNEHYAYGLHRLKCDIRREGKTTINKQVTHVLSDAEYRSVIETGCYEFKINDFSPTSNGSRIEEILGNSYLTKSVFGKELYLYMFLLGWHIPKVSFTINDIIEDWSDFEIEKRHNWIQWCFPTKEKSLSNPFAPAIRSELCVEGHDKEVIQANQKKAFIRFMKFLGLSYVEDNCSINDAYLVLEDIEKVKSWCRHGNHNLKRISRILKSLKLFDLYQEHIALYHFLFSNTDFEPLRETLPKNTISIWHNLQPESMEYMSVIYKLDVEKDKEK